ncbi:MAG: hypothetical protein IPO58_20825 [Betaproteobacteria bacterium]|nr:hypothetical protein [Betaproteobacteria bacterium]
MEIIRSWLIAPANRPEYIGKFATLGADCSVMDLEDGTPGQFKQAARDNLPNLVKQLRAQGLSQGLFVRTNHPRSEHYAKDLAVAAGAAADGVVIPKLGSVAELRAAVEILAPAEAALGRQFKIIGGIESALGVLNVSEIAFCDPRLVALYFGAEDFATDLLGPAALLGYRSPLRAFAHRSRGEGRADRRDRPGRPRDPRRRALSAGCQPGTRSWL